MTDKPLFEFPIMQHAALQITNPPYPVAMNVISKQSYTPSGPYADSTSQSSASSPRSHKATLEPIASQTTQSTISGVQKHEVTPPSSIASSQERNDDEEPSQRSNTTGRKRSANGQIKTSSGITNGVASSHHAGHNRSMSTQSCVSNSSLAELSSSLKTKLSYAMVKVQNGWQSHTLDEVESLASQSPRSTISGVRRDRSTLVSPRVALAAKMRQNGHPTTETSECQVPDSVSTTCAQPSVWTGNTLDGRCKVLAPPASIVSGTRRRQTLNGRLHINTMRPPSSSSRPRPQQRTPSQHAAMEADAVETLLFMSASPNNSGHFPSIFSPTSQSLSTQTSPVGGRFSPGSGRLNRPYKDKNDLVDRLLEELDDDADEELDEALRILQQHRATKVAT